MLEEVLHTSPYTFLSLLLSLLGAYLTLRLIYGAGYKKVLSGLRKLSMAAKVFMIVAFISLGFASSFFWHQVSDYGVRGSVVKAMQYIPSLNEPLNEPLQIELCEGEWFPGCRD